MVQLEQEQVAEGLGLQVALEALEARVVLRFKSVQVATRSRVELRFYTVGEINEFVDLPGGAAAGAGGAGAGAGGAGAGVGTAGAGAGTTTGAAGAGVAPGAGIGLPFSST